MHIETHREGTTETVTLTGRLDTVTTPELQAALGEDFDGLTALVFELSQLEYVSSAGLRFILNAHKKMAGQGGRLVLRNLTAEVLDVLEMTGFTSFLTIEDTNTV